MREFPDIERFIELMKATPSVKNGTKNLSCVKGEIEFKDVCFQYPSRPGEDVLKNMNLKILYWECNLPEEYYKPEEYESKLINL